MIHYITSPTVQLVGGTLRPEAMLILAKDTRLHNAFSRKRLDEIWLMSDEEVCENLRSIAQTIPNVWEFVDYTFSITNVSRAFTHQFVRNRQGSYAQQSMRIGDFGDFDFVMPYELDDEDPDHKAAAEAIRACCESISTCYRMVMEKTGSAEIARSILPTNVGTAIMAKYNLRTLAQMLKKRSGSRVQAEFLFVARQMRARILETHPWAERFIDGEKQHETTERWTAALGKVHDSELRRELGRLFDQVRGAHE